MKQHHDTLWLGSDAQFDENECLKYLHFRISSSWYRLGMQSKRNKTQNRNIRNFIKGRVEEVDFGFLWQGSDALRQVQFHGNERLKYVHFRISSSWYRVGMQSKRNKSQNRNVHNFSKLLGINSLRSQTDFKGKFGCKISTL